MTTYVDPSSPRPRPLIELADGAFAAVEAAAVRLWGEAALPPTALTEVPCGCARVAALHRLHVRRMAVRRQDAGEAWLVADLFPRLDAELAELAGELAAAGLPAAVREAALRGCGDPACQACHPPRCRTCGGVAGECDLSATA
ncbi:MAG: hypothetical protein ACYC61_17800 [Isosphaeraceae bacterium]